MLENIQLSDSLIIGKGRDRIYYIHPHKKNQCIKISISNNKQSKREVRYFKFLTRRHVDLSGISKYQGEVITNLGKGYAFDLITNEDGSVSKTLRQCLESRLFTIDEVQPKLLDLRENLVRNKICVRDISPSNISCQETSKGINLFIIDGISNANINPLTIRLQSLINASITKAWKGLNRKLARLEKYSKNNNFLINCLFLMSI
jgi:hypothetical protein